ncbi:MAG: replication endonuclease [Gammaproteobacteria bacterium]|nr:MAG: replication endonuclease [Gammaproteobacteria bacterium]
MNTALFRERSTWTLDAPLAPSSSAERLTWSTTTRDGPNREFRRRMFGQLPDRLAIASAHSYIDVFRERGGRAANLGLLDTVSAVDKILPLSLSAAASDADIRSLADQKAARCRYLAHPPSRQSMEEICRRAGVKPPSDHVSDIGAMSRMCCRIWWRRQLRKLHARRVEAGEIRVGMVHRLRGLYVSDDTLARRREQKRRTRTLMEALNAVNECGETFTLAEISDWSVSNPRIRRGELMVRLAGMEARADGCGDIAIFVTWTCPSRMHARLSQSSERNPNYDGTTPRQAQSYLRNQWARARSAIARRGLSIEGMRIVEPQHDGTPHWHMLLFIPPVQLQHVCEILRRYALQSDPDEPGADEHRFKAERIDPRRGSATGYLAKYISKNIDGHGLDGVETGRDPKSAAERVEAWASTWGIRQFQQIGGPNVGLWRELRRVHSPLSGTLEVARIAADQGDWAAFTEACEIASEEGARLRVVSVWDDRLGLYGEPRGDRVFGVTDGTIVALSRQHEWQISLSPDKDDFPPWSTVNNCTARCRRFSHRANGRDRLFLLKKSEPPADASES